MNVDCWPRRPRTRGPIGLSHVAAVLRLRGSRAVLVCERGRAYGRVTVAGFRFGDWARSSFNVWRNGFRFHL